MDTLEEVLSQSKDGGCNTHAQPREAKPQNTGMLNYVACQPYKPLVSKGNSPRLV